MARDDIAAFKKRMARLRQGVRQSVGPAVEKSADEMVDMARRLAPTDDGDLRDSIRAVNKQDLGVTVRAGGAETTRQAGGRPYDYALGTEYGTQKQPAQPFFWPAYRLVRSRITGRIRRGVAKAVKDSFK